jgi:hypothetical protein
MSEQDLFNKFKKEYCSKCTNECTERSKGITIAYNLRSARCSEYKMIEGAN